MNPTFGMEEFLLLPQPFVVPVFQTERYNVSSAVCTMIPNSTLNKLLPIK